MADLEIYRNSIETVLDKLSQEILQRCKIETEIMVHNGRNDYDLSVVKKRGLFSIKDKFLPDILIKISIKEEKVFIQQNFTDIKIEKELLEEIIKEIKKVEREHIIPVPDIELDRREYIIPVSDIELNKNYVIVKKKSLYSGMKSFF